MEALAARTVRVRGAEARGEAAREVSVLIYNGHFPAFPCAAGHEFLNTAGLASLAPRVGLVSMIHHADACAAEAALRERGVELFLWKSPEAGHPRAEGSGQPGAAARLHRALTALVHRLRAFPSRPLDTITADLEFRNMSHALLEATGRRRWDVLVVVQSSSARVIDYLPEPDAAVLVMHDIRSLLYARRAEVARSRLERLWLRAESRRYFEFEKRYCRRYGLVIALSEADADWIRRNYAPRRLAVVPIPVDLEYFAPAAGCAEAPAEIVFTGLMDHPPNVDAAVFFAREVFPLIRRRAPEARFLVVGKSPAGEVRELAALPGVEVTGMVPDTRDYLARASVVVVPLRFGSGVRNKILEAWGMEKCVVSTSLGAEGLDYRHGGNLLIADDAAALAETIVAALGDPERRRAIGAAGRRMAARLHDPGAAAARYYAHLRAAAAEKPETPMRVALDMRWLQPGVAGGIEIQARLLVSELLALDGYNSYTLILPSVSRYLFDLRRRPNFRVICRDSILPVAQDLLWRAAASAHARLGLDYWRSREVRQLEFLRSLEAEIVYSFPGYIHPEVRHLRQVLAVPDIQHEYLPELFCEEALRERRRIYTESIRRADLICAVSEFTRRTLIERLGTPPEKVVAVPLAADPVFRPAKDPPRDEAVLRKYRLERGYLFFPAHVWRHKNHRAVVSAMSILGARGGAPVLVCTGEAREGQPELERQIAECSLAERVRFLGYCPREEMPSLYRNAGCLVFPSRFEGFGMPVLEAMACGCPVVASNAASLPEVAGNAALLVDPEDTEGLAEAIAQVLGDQGLRRELRARGLARAAMFSWRRHALETVAVLRRLHEQTRTHLTT